MQVSKILSFLTYPERSNDTAALPSGTEIPIDEGKLCKMLLDMFSRSDEECNIPILFTPEDGQQINIARTELLALVNSPCVEAAQALANRLQSVTTKTSGMGLLFFCIGTENGKTKIVISRFPADEGVVAERGEDKLTVSFVEQVFLKSAHSYKSVLYNDMPTGFWMGAAVDKQINHGSKAIAGYWIVEFLKSDFQTTSAAGTKRLALALRAATLVSQDMAVKHEISSCVQLANNLPTKAITISEFCSQFSLSVSAKELVCKQVDPARLLNEKFKFDKVEFAKHISYKLIELDNGAVLSAEVSKFDQCFKTTGPVHERTYTTTGRIIQERLRKTK